MKHKRYSVEQIIAVLKQAEPDASVHRYRSIAHRHESLRRCLRNEFLNAHWFRNLTDAKDKIEMWRRDYNEARSHQALNYLTPNEFAAQQENWSQKTKP
jgi:transposase InsO family protein